MALEMSYDFQLSIPNFCNNNYDMTFGIPKIGEIMWPKCLLPKS